MKKTKTGMKKKSRKKPFRWPTERDLLNWVAEGVLALDYETPVKRACLKLNGVKSHIQANDLMLWFFVGKNGREIDDSIPRGDKARAASRWFNKLARRFDALESPGGGRTLKAVRHV
jgi:hypothetical protein